MADAMTKAERESILRIIRQRERVAKTAAAERTKSLLADFEAQLDRRYDFDEDAVWHAATAAAQEVVAAAQAKIRERCEELRIPEQFAPGLSVTWYSRGRNAVTGERAEMRRLARRRIEQIEASARVEIEKASLTAQERLIGAGLTSEDAQAALAMLPTVESLMPLLVLADVQETLASPKSLSSNAGIGEIETDL